MTQSKEEQNNITKIIITDSEQLSATEEAITGKSIVKKEELVPSHLHLLSTVENIPDKVDKNNVIRGIEYFLLQHGITEKIVHVKYLGGCSNHALKVTIETEENGLKNVLVRLPGSFSELLVNREAERVNTAIVAELGVCPAFAKQFAIKGNLLQLEGYKVEDFLENAKPLTHETFNRHRKMALAQLKKVHQCGKQFETEYNLLERLKLMCYSLQGVVGERIFFNPQREGQKYTTIDAIILQIEQLEKLAKAFGKISLLPCHNDIPPFNFMIISKENEMDDIKIIDWEYGGMNDPMCELAYIANENGYHNRDAIIDLINDYYAGDQISNTELQINIDRILFYLPLIDLKVAIWSLMQVHMCNQSQYIEELRSGWGPERYDRYLEKINSNEYKELLVFLESKLNHSITQHSLFKVRDHKVTSETQITYTL